MEDCASEFSLFEADKVPLITYGVLPAGWEQEIPEDGPPLSLLEGYVYYVQAVLVREGVGNVHIHKERTSTRLHRR